MVEMMIFLPCSMNRRRSPDRSACPTVAFTWAYRRIVSVDLTIQDDPVGYHDDRVEDRTVISDQPDQLMGQPGDGVAFAAPGGVLDQIAPTLLREQRRSPKACAPHPVGDTAARSVDC